MRSRPDLEEKLARKLVAEGLATEDVIEEARARQSITGQSLSRILLGMGAVSELAMARALSEVAQVPFIQLEHYLLDPKLAWSLPQQIAEEREIVPIKQAKLKVTLAVPDPMDVALFEELERILRCAVRIAVATPSAIRRAIADLYGSLSTSVEPSSPSETVPQRRGTDWIH
jgi:MSHA biogenesis protein MshE